MDPYLEDPAHWPDFHAEMISTCRGALVAQLRPRYSVRIEERVYVAGNDDRTIQRYVPDLRISKRKGRHARSSNGSKTAVLETPEPVIATTLLDPEIRENFLEIRDVVDKRVVTVIEILSPANKARGSEGRRLYLLKRHEIMLSGAHLVEIDLLRAGERIPLLLKSTGYDYLIHVSRVEERPRGLLWPLRLNERLPALPIPLKKGDADARLDLQAVLDDVYDRAGYDFDVDYSSEPIPRLPTQDAPWAAKILKTKRVRGK